MIEFQDNGPDDIVETRAKSAAGHHGAFELAWIKIDLFPGTGLLKTEQVFIRIYRNMVRPDIHDDPGVFRDKPGTAVGGNTLGDQRRGDSGHSQNRDFCAEFSIFH